MELEKHFPDDWLLPVELYELAVKNGDSGFAKDILAHLEKVKQNHPNFGALIDDGISETDAERVKA